MHKVLRGQVDHAGCYLLGNVQHLTLGQLHGPGGLALGHQNSIGSMSPVRGQVGNMGDWNLGNTVSCLKLYNKL